MEPKASVLTLFLALFSTVTIHLIAHNPLLSNAHIRHGKSQNAPRGLRLGQVLMSAPTTAAGDPVLWLARPGVKLVLYLR